MKRLAPTWIEIDRAALRFNFKQLKEKLPKGCQTLAIVKSNAYGHGAAQVAKALGQADCFGVGTVDEGIELREAGIKKPILILLGIIGSYFEELVTHQLTPVLYDLEVAHELNHFLLKRKQVMQVHLKVDTGMTRLGILPIETENFFTRLLGLKSLRPVGLLSHLADAGQEQFTRGQVKALSKAWQLFVQFFPRAKFYHLANSLATIDSRALAPDGVRGRTLMTRLGIALYGAYPLPRQRKKMKLQPVMSWKSRLIAVKPVPKGTTVSYGRTFKAKRTSVIGVVPVGYADGYFRNLSNRAHVLVRGRRVPIVGMICMDMMMVDLTGHRGVVVGDEVVLLGQQGDESIRAEELALLAGTISYEVFCRVASRLPRNYRG